MSPELEIQALKLIKQCVDFAKQFLTIPDSLEIAFMEYNPVFFAHMNVPCMIFADGKNIIFNNNWR